MKKGKRTRKTWLGFPVPKDALTDAELKRFGRLGSTATLKQARILMKLLDIQELHGERTPAGGCPHLVKIRPAVTFDDMVHHIRGWNFRGLVMDHSRETIRRNVLFGTGFLEDGSYVECDITGESCPFARDDDGGERRCTPPEGGCALPPYADRHPERDMPDGALEVIAGLTGCCSCDCLGKHWCLSECSGYGGQADHLKARYLAKCWEERQRKAKGK